MADPKNYTLETSKYLLSVSNSCMERKDLSQLERKPRKYEIGGKADVRVNIDGFNLLSFEELLRGCGIGGVGQELFPGEQFVPLREGGRRGGGEGEIIALQE